MKDNSPVKLTPFKKQGHHNHYFKRPSVYQKLDFTQLASNTSQEMMEDQTNTSNNNILNETLKFAFNNNSFQSFV